MSSFRVRQYQDEDREMVKEIFTLGMSEHIPASFVHVLKQPLTQMVLMCVFGALLASSRSFLLPVLAVTLLLAGTRQVVSYLFTSYIDTSLKDDLSSIQENYLEKRDSCFWVAESEGRVVAMVACMPVKGQQGSLELKRMSVQRSHRSMGIAKALCKVVADFAHERGYQTVILYTSVVQTDAQKLYEHMSFKKIRQFVVPSLIGRLSNFSILEYRLEVQESPGR
ncbi:probable N-acetyltransferase CML1 [Scleropages formosus]|uniref:N-acetyltransferase domain-containing protein n=2 Tax=Scleropages formosus TaxID=113540 RepID=A0A8C9SM01_SCLFO|nr:probable N-acetyltransferase CML1 [Scleropages formosus]